ncbi:hypothetical protein D3C79_713170 [compost metagenome]
MLLGLLLAKQGFLLTLFGHQRALLLCQLLTGLLELFNGLLARFVQIAKIGQHAFTALGFFTAEHQLQGAVLPLAEGGIELFGEDFLLSGLLFL